MGYFVYTINGGRNARNFASSDKSQIADTIRYYREQRKGYDDWEIPSDKDLEFRDKLNVHCQSPDSSPGRRVIHAPLLDDFSLEVDVKAFDDVLKEIKGRSLAERKRGELYQFINSRQQSGNVTWFLPEKIIKAMENYGWEKNRDYVRPTTNPTASEKLAEENRMESLLLEFEEKRRQDLLAKISKDFDQLRQKHRAAI